MRCGRALLLLAIACGTLLAPPARRAEAGCICPPLTNVQVGDLVVRDATVRRQRWTVRSDQVKLELDLGGVSAATRIDVLAMGIPDDEYESFLELARLNREPGDDPKMEVAAGALRLTSKTTRRKKGDIREVRVAWTVAEAGSTEGSVMISWRLPLAGADELPQASKERMREFCIDASTARAMKKRVHGFHRVDVVISETMATELTLRIERHELPISLCASMVEKKDRNAFEIRGRENLKDRNRVLPILFAESI
jgi:hypothetical protein